ncbi:MAG: hypothetical protein KDC66_15435 [Phaeodactylibacter sp.]|nr:hypothetical protein [Phaeodactylibacter sp.]MCB9276139.1 hypothetical protein [Lewinellaceae bacterium]
MSQTDNDKSQFGGTNSGNIWPWKFSILGLALIILLGVVIAYRHYSMKVPIGFEDPLKQAEQEDTSAVDTLNR